MGIPLSIAIVANVRRNLQGATAIFLRLYYAGGNIVVKKRMLHHLPQLLQLGVIEIGKHLLHNICNQFKLCLRMELCLFRADFSCPCQQFISVE